ncbi:hypothetical protein ACFSL4_30735 [Streptomyces caeni]|uniref:DUF2267 domain-containing protein n=1 Tax=Streptomyces caeni TaxID=2307231 RepID=A0ABW4J130_9ACTN
MAAANIEDYIRKVIRAAPPLSAAQRTRLAALLAPGIAAARSSEDGGDPA